MLVWMESQTTRAIGQVLTLLHTISTTSTTSTTTSPTESPYALSPTLAALLARYAASTLTTPTTTSSTSPTKPVTGTGTGTLKKEDPLKEAEESILNNLKTLGKFLRGAAELLTDPTTTTDSTTTTSTTMDVDGSGISTGSNNSTYLTTAREALQKLLTPETRKYASEIRLIVLEFLIFIHERLSTLSPTAPTTTTTSTSVTTSSSGEVASVYASLGNNALVRGAWVKLLSICITRRQACKNM